jgi:chromosome segregation ATPase
MPTPFPESVRATLGEKGAEDLIRWLDDYLQERAVHRDERPDREGGSTLGVYREVLSRLDVLEERISQLEERIDQRFEQVDQRFEQVNQRFEQVDKRFEQVDQRFQQVDERFQQVDQRFQQVDQRFQQVDDRFGQMDGRFTGINQRLDDLQVQMRRQIRWSVGTIALFGTIITVLIAIAEFSG